MYAPPLTLVEVPVRMRVSNESEVRKAVLYQGIGLELEVENRGAQVIEAELLVEESDDFYIGGELKSLLSMMPYTSYRFSYNVVPLQIGRLPLPKFNLVDVADPERPVTLVKGFTKKCLIVK